MNMLEAMRDTVALMEARLNAMASPAQQARIETLNVDLQPPHLRDMLRIMSSGINPQDTEAEFGEGKMGRWLGWAQGAVVAMGLASLDDMKSINKSHAEKKDG